MLKRHLKNPQQDSNNGTVDESKKKSFLTIHHYYHNITYLTDDKTLSGVKIPSSYKSSICAVLLSESDF